jgi:hypothetical protein
VGGGEGLKVKNIICVGFSFNGIPLSKNHIFFLATARDENKTAATTSTCFVNNIFLCTPKIERRFKAHSQNNFKSRSL